MKSYRISRNVYRTLAGLLTAVIIVTIPATAAAIDPVINSATLTVSEDQTVTLAGGNFSITDPDSSTFTYTISGLSGGIFQLSSASGTPITSFTSADLSGGTVQFVDHGNEVAPAFSVTVNDGVVNSNTLAAAVTYTSINDPLSIDSVSNPATDEAQNHEVTITISDVDSSSWTYWVDWNGNGANDGGDEEFTDSSKTVSMTYLYPDDFNQTIAIEVSDNDGDTQSTTATVVVNNVTPTVGATTSPQSADEGVSTPFTIPSFTDPGTDGDWTVTIAWDDDEEIELTRTTDGAIPDQSHTYADDGSYTVSVTAAEAGVGAPESAPATFTVNVANLAPAVTPPADSGGFEGTQYSFNMGSFSDPGADGPWQVTVD